MKIGADIAVVTLKENRKFCEEVIIFTRGQNRGRKIYTIYSRICSPKISNNSDSSDDDIGPPSSSA
jgi:hypothetical protein